MWSDINLITHQPDPCPGKRMNTSWDSSFFRRIYVTSVHCNQMCSTSTSVICGVATSSALLWSVCNSVVAHRSASSSHCLSSVQWILFPSHQSSQKFCLHSPSPLTNSQPSNYRTCVLEVTKFLSLSGLSSHYHWLPHSFGHWATCVQPHFSTSGPLSSVSIDIGYLTTILFLVSSFLSVTS